MIDSVLGFVESILTYLHDLLLPLFGANSWGWAIIALTLIARVALLPLAIKQTRSMRAMQAIQPQMKALQKKHKVDKDLLKKDPVQYKAKKAKLNEAMMALYKEEGANPAASCLPLIAQAPIFIALFYTLRQMTVLGDEGFYFFTDFADPSRAEGLRTTVSAAGWPGWLLIVLMSGTMFLTQKQMMSRNAAQMADNPMAQQQKILLYVMPIFLAVISFQFPIGILLYWVTTNVWQVAQQGIILREVRHEAATGELANKPGGEAARKPAARWKRQPKITGEVPGPDEAPARPTSPGASSGKRATKPAMPPEPDETTALEDDLEMLDGPGRNGTEPSTNGSHRAGEASSIDEEAGSNRSRGRDHLPRRGGNAPR